MSQYLFLVESNKRAGPNVWANNLSRMFQQYPEIRALTTYSFTGFVDAIKLIFKAKTIHFYSQTFPALLLFLIAILLRKKVIYTIHGDILLENTSKKGSKKLLWLPVHHIIIRFASAITFPSAYTQKVNNKIVPSDKYQMVIHNGIALEREPRKEVPPLSPFVCTIITSFTHPLKTAGVDTIAQALAFIDFPITLDVVGGGPLLEEYKEKYQKMTNITFCGYLTDPFPVLKRSHLFTYVSYQDNLPYSIFDAIMTGIPVISNDIGAVPSVVGPDELLRNITPESLAAAISSFRDTNKLKSVAKQQLAVIKQKFSAQQMAKQFHELYQRVAASGSNKNTK